MQFLRIRELNVVCKVALFAIVALLTPVEVVPSSIHGTWTKVVNHAQFSSRDTGRPVVFRGKLWISSGYPGEGYMNWDRDLWSSADGVTWSRVLEHTPYWFFSRLVVFKDKLWAIADSVWNSDDGANWVEVLNSTPFANVNSQVVVHNGRLWQLGDGPEVWSSPDGVNWSCVTSDAPYGNRQDPAVAAYGGKLWVMGGSSPNPGKGFSNSLGLGYPDVDMSDDVWYSTDGANWTLATGHAPWKGRVWATTSNYAGALWLMAGYDNDAYANIGDAWYTTDGVRWQRFQSDDFWSARHLPASYVFKDSLWLVAGNAWPFTNDVWKLTTSSFDCSGIFSAAVSSNADSNPRAVAAGDFDGDGKSDLAVANLGSDDVSILLGKGDGTFRKAVNYQVGSSPSAVAVGDFNGDGRIDLAVANAGSNSVSILLGNGDGTFADAVNYPVGSFPRALVAADLNADGKLDLAVANANSNSVSVLFGNGNGNFTKPASYPVGDSPQSIAYGDFDGDGRVDLAVANFRSNSVSILSGSGRKTFAAAVNFNVASNPNSIVVADFNGDGRPDIVVTSEVSRNVSILLGRRNVNGKPAFAAVINEATDSAAEAVAAADFDGDGKVDLAIANLDEDTVSIMAGHGDGTFATPVNYQSDSRPASLISSNFKGDGRPDLAIVNSNSNNVSILLNRIGLPCISAISPTAGPIVGAQTVNITGTNLSSSSVSFGGATGKVTTNTATSITVTTPAHAGSVVDLTVSNVKGSAVSAASYTFENVPTVSSVSPAGGSVDGDQAATISGADLGRVTSIMFGGVPVTNIIDNTTTAIKVITPLHPTGLVDVAVTTAGGSVTLAGGYYYGVAPRVVAVSPNAGPVGGAQIVTIAGTGLTGATSVTVGGVRAEVVSNTDSSIVIITPRHDPGFSDVIVTTAIGVGTLSSSYTFRAQAAISAIGQ